MVDKKGHKTLRALRRKAIKVTETNGPVDPMAKAQSIRFLGLLRDGGDVEAATVLSHMQDHLPGP
ncbi:hypothetical protein FRB95_010336 [Tulasnella sp. JGI-2019a]|nr:hypothetical protein FRB93_010806 [Tulasnella sp. JGI-2019a]KAG9025313.1 hypothetical protein FRB95_010336 [Tulasnella sp. JGI-2019a]